MDEEDFILPHTSITGTTNEHLYKVKSEPENDNGAEAEKKVVQVVEKNIYICTQLSCLAKFSDALKLKIHRSKHYPKNCRCTICDIGHPDEQSFQVHKSTYHNLQSDGTILEPLRCYKCAKISKDFKALKRHIIESHRPNKFPCHYCSFQFTRPENLRAHIHKVHTDTEKEEFKCRSCDRIFSHKNTLRTHIREHHRDTGEHKCCEKIFKNIFAYKRHERRVHGPIQLTKCKVCGVYTDGRHESRHERTKFHLNALKKKNCQGTSVIKTKKEIKIEDIKQEIKTVSESDDSDRAFDSDENALKPAHKDLSKICRLCQKPFKNLQNHLKSAYHIRRVKNVQQKEKFELLVQDQDKSQEIYPAPQKISVHFDMDIDVSCKTCQMEFTTKGMLKSHLKSASHVKIFNFLHNHVKEEENVKVIKLECSICEMTFKYKSRLTAHLTTKVHLDKIKSLKSYSMKDMANNLSCKICQMELPTKGMLKSHLKSVSHLEIYNVLNNPVKEENVQVRKLLGCSTCDRTFKYKYRLTAHLTRKCHLNKIKNLKEIKKEPLDDHLVISNVKSLPPKITKNLCVLVEKLDLNIIAKCIDQNDYGPIMKNIKLNQRSSKQIKNGHVMSMSLDSDFLAKNFENSNLHDFENGNDIVIKEEDLGYDNILQVEDSNKNEENPQDTDDDGEISLYCMYCDSPFKSLVQVQAHEIKCVQLRASRKTHKCSTCHKIYTQKTHLDRHTLQVHTTPSAPLYPCTFSDCRQIFKNQFYRTLHEKRVHLQSEHKICENKPKPKYDCCGKSFVNIKSYKQHIDRVHYKIKHPCPTCPFVSTDRGSLQEHIRNKHGEGAYKCKVCDQVFHNEKRMAEHLTRKRHLAMVKGVKYYNRNI